MDVIPGLLRSKNKAEASLKEKEKEVLILKFLLIVSWVVFIIFFFC